MQALTRYLESAVRKDLARKMVFVGGPRQAGKTTLARSIEPDPTRYLNWDDDEDRERILRRQFPTGPGVLILDEVHKYARWRQAVKGLFDKRAAELHIMVTGSARLDYYRRGGDSLQGRYHYYRLHPLSVAEVGGAVGDALAHLLHFGGFPEPFSLASESETRRWSREYRTRLIREDLRDLEHVRELSLIEKLALRLPELVGSPLSLNSLREDLQVSHASVRRWIEILERTYSVFRIYPYGAATLRAAKKEAKHYHFDWTLVQDKGARFENLVACHLLKWCHYRQDTEGWETELRFFRDNEKREVDFILMNENRPVALIECKSGDRSVSPHLRYLSRRLPGVPAVQLVGEGDIDYATEDGIRVCNAARYLATLV